MMSTDRWIEKNTWSDGPWQHEPDRVEWRAGGFPCLALRHPRHGNWCGYVGLAPGHPWHGKDYDDIDVDVHGGLTFAGPCMDDERPARERICHTPLAGESEDVWWLGFDCHHFMDIAPGMDADLKTLGMPELHFPGDAYRALPYVQREVESLARQCQENA